MSDVDSKFIAKCELIGNTIVEVAAERERQKANAPRLPSMLQELVTKQYLERDDAAIEKRISEAARLRANPKLRQKKPVTEAELLVAQAPKSSAQVIGHHKVFELKPVAPKPKKTDELSVMRTYYPQSEGHAYGFHHQFSVQDANEAASATEITGKLTVAQIKSDPKLAKALATMKERVVRLGSTMDSMGQTRGIKFRQPS